MKKILFNAKIYLSRDNFAQAVYIEDEVIEKVGTNDEILALAADDCEKIDCQGRTVIPGLNDSHLHITMVGERLSSINITGCTSIDEVVERCKRFIAENPEQAKSGIYGTGWNQDLFTSGEKRYLYRRDLDRVSTEIPIVLARICGHIVAANSKAIEIAGIKPDTKIEGGTFDLGDDGLPNGFFSEFACGVLRATVPDTNGYDEVKAYTLKGMQYAASRGLTSIQTNDIGQCNLGNELTFKLIRELYEEGVAPVRYHHQLCFRETAELEAYLKSDERKDPCYKKDTWLTLGPLKLFKDGSLGARTATTRKEYLDDPRNFGVEAMSDALIDEMVAIADKEGMQVVTHAIGDDAIEKMLNSYEKVIGGGENKNRHSIVHYQCLDLPLIERTARLGVLAQVQPIFLTTDLHAVPSRFSKEMNRYFLALKTNHEKGVKQSIGSDSPVEDCNPFYNIYCAVTRRDLSGVPENGFFPEECIDVSLCIDLFTEGSAYCQFQEDVKGRIREGMLADVVVLDRDIFTVPSEEIKDILPVMTIVGGRVVYSK